MLRQALGVLLLLLAPGAAALSLDVAGPAGTQVGVDGTAVDASAAGQDLAVAADGTALAVTAPALPTVDLDAGALDLALAPQAEQADAPAPSNGGSTIAGVPTEVAIPAAAGASAIGLAILWRLLGISIPFAGRLFSRIDTPRVLDNAVRSRLNDLVAARPGATLEELRAAAGIAWGTAVHHLRRLEAHGLIVATVGARHRFFPANTAASKHRASLSALAQPTAQRIARLVHDAPGIGQGQLCQALGLQAPAASKHLARLSQQGLVIIRVDGRRRAYDATDALRAAFAASGPATAALPSPMLMASTPPVVTVAA